MPAPMVERQANGRRAREQQRRVDAHFQQTAGYWKEIYQSHDLESLIYQHRRLATLAMVEALTLRPGSPVLEVGCGAGFTTVALSQRGYVVEAIDTVPDMLDQTRRLAVQAGVDHLVTTNSDDIHRLGYPDNAFDLVVAIGVLPWLHSPHQAIREMARVLKPGGHLVVSADNRWRLNRLLDPSSWARPFAARLFRRITQRHPVAIPRWRLHSIRKLDRDLAEAGFEKMDAMTLGFGPFSFLGFRFLPAAAEVKVHRKLQNLADRGTLIIRSTGSHYLVLARKAAMHQA
jgi:ubiquinone/menaquinone biosynthesis C-methylase UbiE